MLTKPTQHTVNGSKRLTLNGSQHFIRACSVLLHLDGSIIAELHATRITQHHYCNRKRAAASTKAMYCTPDMPRQVQNSFCNCKNATAIVATLLQAQTAIASAT